MDKKFNICGIDFRVSDIDTETISLFSTGDRDDFYQLTCFINKTNCKWEALVIKENCYKHKNQRYTVTDARTKSGEATVYKNVLPENVISCLIRLIT